MAVPLGQVDPGIVTLSRIDRDHLALLLLRGMTHTEAHVHTPDTA
jgi:hypothetical protein